MARDRVSVVPIPQTPSSKGIFAPSETAAYQIYEWLKDTPCDEVHLPAAGGIGLFCIDAKRQGVAFSGTVFRQRAGSTAVMRQLAKLMPVDSVELLTRDHLERRCLERACEVIVPGEPLAAALRSHGVAMPVNRTVICHDAVPPAPGAPAAPQPPRQLLVLGPLGHEGGVPAVCTALSRLAADGCDTVKRVIFAGPSSDSLDIKALVNEKARSWPFDATVVPDPAREQVAAWLRDPSVLTLFGAPGPEGPGWLPDALSHGRAVRVHGLGGGLDIIHPDDRAVAAVDGRPNQMAAALAEAFASVPAAIRPKPTDAETTAPRRPIASRGAPPRPDVPSQPLVDSEPLVSVCVMHHERPDLVRQALQSVRAQSYRNLEVVLVDDGSRSPAAIQVLRELESQFSDIALRVVRQANSYLGAARNTAARHAHGTFLYFLDDDNALKPGGIATFVAAAQRTGADIVTAFSDAFDGQAAPDGSAVARHVFTGDNAAVGLFANCFGDSNALIRRASFEALGGNSEDYGVGKDDQEFFARAVLGGYRLELVPEALYWARRSQVRLRHKHFAEHAGELRVSRPYRAALPVEIGNVALLAQGQHLAATRAAVAGSVGDAAAMRDTLTEASQHLAHAPRLQGFAGRAYNAQKAAFQALIAFEVRLVRLASGVVRRLARDGS